MDRKGQLKALFGLNRGLVLYMARSDWGPTTGSNTWIFPEPITDSMSDRSDEKRMAFCRLRIGRGFPGCE